MPNPIESLLATGTKLWLDSIDPDLVRSNRAMAATGATSNPIIVADLLATGPVRRRDRATGAPGARRRPDRLADDRHAGPRRPAGLPARLGADPRQRRLRELRARSAAGGPGAEPGPRQAGQRVRAAGAGVVGGPSEPDDQGAGHARRSGRPGRTGRRRRDGQRHVDLHVRGSIGWPATPCGAAPSGARASTGFKSVYSIFVSRLGRVHREGRARSFRPPRRAWWASSTPSGFGPRTSSTGPSSPRRLGRRSSSPARARRSPAIRPGNTSRPSPAATSRPTRRPPTRPSPAAAAPSPGRSTSCRPPAVVEEIDRLVDMEKLEATLMAEGIAKFANPQKALLALVAKKTCGPV